MGKNAKKPTAKSTGKVPAKAPAKVPGKVSNKPAARPVAKPAPAPKSAAKPVVKSAVKPAAKPAVKPASKSAVKPVVKTAAKPTVKPAAKPVIKPAAKSAAKPAAKPAVKPVIKPTAKPAAKPATAPPVKKTGKVGRPAGKSSGKSASKVSKAAAKALNKPIVPVAEEGSLALYFKEIGKLQPLTSDHEAELAAKIRKGDRRSLDTLVKANLRFVVSVARNYQNQGLSLCDLINEGNMGLVKAAKRFDEKKNFRFISYAVWWVRQAILQALAEQSRIMRLPLNRAGTIHKISKTQIELEQRLKRMPNTLEIANELSMTESAVQETISISNNYVSLDAPIKDNNGSTLIDLIGSSLEGGGADENIRAMSQNEEIRQMLDSLTMRERDIIKLYFGIDHDHAYTLDQIGDRFKITRERVRQIKSKALNRLKSANGVQITPRRRRARIKTENIEIPNNTENVE